MAGRSGWRRCGRAACAHLNRQASSGPVGYEADLIREWPRGGMERRSVSNAGRTHEGCARYRRLRRRYEHHKLIVEFAIAGAPTETVDVKILPDSVYLLAPARDIEYI